MTFTTKKTDQNGIELTIELGKEDLGHYIKETEQALGKSLEVPGFRKGKVPNDVIKKQLGDSKILEAALQTAMQRSLARVIQEQGLDVLEASDLKIKDNSAERLIYTVALRLFPAVTMPPLETIKVQRRPVTVETKEIDQTLETLKASRAILTDKDGAAEQGDRVEVDFEVSEDGKLIDGGSSKNHPVVIGNKNFIPGFEEELIGLRKGEHKDFSLTAPRDFANKEIAGKKLDFKVTIQEVKKVTMPELTDDFARSIGKFDNIDQLILNLKDGLAEEKKDKERQRLRLEIINKIIEGSRCDAPAVMITEQLDSMIENFDQDLHRHDMELGLYLSKLGKTQDDLRKEWQKEAERHVKMALILHAVAREREISVEPEEVTQALEALVQSTMIREGGQNLDFDMERMRASIRSRLLNERTLEFLERTCAV